MSTEGSVSASPAAGWYRDPANAVNVRWWDGVRWTDQIRFAAPELHDVPPTVVPEVIVHTVEREYVPFQHEREVALVARRRGVSYTRPGWWISSQPLWTAVLLGALLGVLSVLGGPIGAASILAILGIVVVGWLASVALAFGDAALLIRGGNGGSASALWAVLTPLAYLIARGREIRTWDDSPWGALIWWVVAAVLSPAFGAVAFFAVLGILP
jgi:hypothetical protein